MADIQRMHRNSDGVFDLFINEVAKTANYTIVAGDNGILFTNTAAGGAVVFTLPAIGKGYYFGFLVTADQSVTVSSAAGSDMVTIASITASSVAFTTSGQKIGRWLRVYSNLAGDKWLTEQGAMPGLTDAEIGVLDGVTAGTGAASKALVLDSNGSVSVPDDGVVAFGTVGRLSWDTTDANANELLLQLPAGGAVDVPVVIIGQSIESVDFGLYNGVTEPRVAMFGIGAVATGPVFEFRKARGTVASPTVVTSADDIGQVDFYAAVAAGEYVRSAQILAECTGTVATTRGPGVLTFKTATDAAPSVLTNALSLSAAQNATIGGGAATQTLTFDTSGTDVVLSASSAALAMGAITLNVTGTRFVQSYHTNITSTNAVTVDSSETVKLDIEEYAGDAVELIKAMDVITFRHEDWLDGSGEVKLGIRAESVHEPLALKWIERDSGAYPGVNLYSLIAIQARAIQQLTERLEALEA